MNSTNIFKNRRFLRSGRLFVLTAMLKRSRKDSLSMAMLKGSRKDSLCLAMLLCLSLVPAASALQNDPASDAPASAQTSDHDDSPQTPQDDPQDHEIVTHFLEESPASETPSQPRDPASYGLWTLAPALVAIILAIITRQVIPALFIGILAGAYMLVPCLSADDPLAGSHSVIAGLRLAAETYIIGVIIDPDNGFGKVKIMIFTLVIGFTVGVIGRNGGTAGMVRLVTGRTVSTRRGALTTWLAGLVVFFDDYANMMIIGPTMRSVFDRLKISRAKLAYIIDSTAAPVASIALIGTWVGTEISYINDGLKQLQQTGVPDFLLDTQGNLMSGMTAFLYSLPYRFYPLLALFLVFLVCLTGRDFGPMKKSQNKSAKKILTNGLAKESEHTTEPTVAPNWWLGLIPIATLIIVTLGVLIRTGWVATADDPVLQQPDMVWWHKLSTIIGGADSYLSIFYGALLSAMVAVILTAISRAVNLKETVDAGLEGMARMFPAIVILILAWALSAVEQDLKLSEIAGDRLIAASFPPEWLPLTVFLCAAGISFATGTAWGTMGILCPVAVTLSAGLASNLEAQHALTIFYATVGSVLAGAVFGDHCSPISDTTVLSSIAADCPHEEHVWTQLPYALVTAVAAMGLGDVLCSVYQQPWYVGLGAGALLLLFVVIVIGRQPRPAYELIASSS